MGIWVFSPVNAVDDALKRYVTELGFDVEPDPAKANAALFDLGSAGSPLPPAPSVPSLALLGSADQDLADEARRAGYVPHLSTDSEDQLRGALAMLLAGRSNREDATLPGVERAAPADAPQLTPRETQVMSLLMLGLTNKHIAKHLLITERTVKFHVAALMRKHGVKNRTKLMLKNPIVVTRLFSGRAARRRQ
jgi:DNA-binding CsgD family transcriptional regulator